MDPTFFTRGFVIGLTVAMGIGPMSVLTMRRTIAHGRLYGLVSALGIATVPGHGYRFIPTFSNRGWDAEQDR